MNDVREAANRKGLDVDQTIFEIKAYANRNAAGHTGIGRMIDGCDWQALAERIEYDKATFNTVFANEPNEAIIMRVAIGRLASTWLESTGWRGNRVVFIFGEKRHYRSRRR